MQGSEVGFGILALVCVTGAAWLLWRWANRALDDLEHWDDE